MNEDLIKRLQDPEQYTDAVDEAIEILRAANDGEALMNLRLQYSQLKNEHKLVLAELVDLNSTSADALQCLWEDIILSRKPDYGDWEYPGQAYRHILCEITEIIEEERTKTEERLERKITEMENLMEGQKKATCHWTRDKEERTVWYTECNHRHHSYQKPSEHYYDFCPFCGNEIVEVYE